MLGKLSWAAIPLDEPLPMAASGLVGLVVAGVLATVVLKGWLPYLWNAWVTGVDHKRIGVMYCVLALVMLLRCFPDAIMMRAQQALAYDAPGFLPPEHYNQIFSAHGTLMTFFVDMPFVIGLMSFAVPLQLGIRDIRRPRDRGKPQTARERRRHASGIRRSLGKARYDLWVSRPTIVQQAHWSA